MKGVVIAGTGSGVGKTVATMALIHRLRTAGYVVQPGKIGPDYIDPSHHSNLADQPSRTLDPWLQGMDGMRRNYWRGSGDICVVEGVMGLFDGTKMNTAEVADVLSLPVILVVDAHGNMDSIGAMALGFQEYCRYADVEIEVIGIIAQRAHGGSHETGIKRALPESIDYFGRIPPIEELSIPERHLGLQLPTEVPLDDRSLEIAGEHLDIDRILAVATEPPAPQPDEQPSIGRESTITTAVASDRAFCFTYPAVTELLWNRGSVATFSPLAGDPVPPCDGVYLPGGYPELHAAELSDSPTLESIRDRAVEGVPVFGECGGMMTLGSSLTVEGKRYDMADILPIEIEMTEQLQAIDHVEIEAMTRSPIGSDGDIYRGHEFHYSRAYPALDARFAFTVQRGSGFEGENEGAIEYNTLGTYCHLHAESGAFDSFLKAATP